MLGVFAMLAVGLMLLGGRKVEPVLTWAHKPLPGAGDPTRVGAPPNPALTTGEIRVLSNRADLISGGDALVEVVLPAGMAAHEARVDLNGRDVTSEFAQRANGRYMGLVTGLTNGANQLTAQFAGGEGQRIIITNHSKGGPVFAGPQVLPWLCKTEEEGLGPAVDAQCNAPSKTAYVYQPQGKALGTYEDYDPENPPQDVASTRTDEGHVVPYIVRMETGTLDRSIYTLAVLAHPSQPWHPWAPQKGWNGKVFIPFAGGCGTVHAQMPPTMFAGEQVVLRHEFISRGWMGTTSGLNALGYNCNEVVSAEAVMMQKEHIEEQYGPIRHVIGRGGSGGSIQQNNIAAAYPALLDGVTTDSTFPDAWTPFSDAVDCQLLNHYFVWIAPQLWVDRKQAAAVMGKSGIATCLQWTVLFGDVGDPQGRGGLRISWLAARKGCALPADQLYHPTRNPTGARCSVADYQSAIWGRRGPRHVSTLPLDNEGVQYGLVALRKGIISAEQFVDLNHRIGGLDDEWEFVPRRMTMDLTTTTTLYRASRLSDPRQMANTPMIDVRNNADRADLHQPYMSWVLRARLDAANGDHGNQVIWDHPGDEYKDDAVFAMDHWLIAIEQDSSDLTREQKIVRNRPAELVDTCWIEGKSVTDDAACRKAHSHASSDARIAAGGPLSSDIRTCQLKPLNRADYPVRFTDSQWATLLDTFPRGVCDWTKPGVGTQPSEPWMTYAGGPGGQPLGPAPQSSEVLEP
jgi:hypothetical protein